MTLGPSSGFIDQIKALQNIGFEENQHDGLTFFS